MGIITGIVKMGLTVGAAYAAVRVADKYKERSADLTTKEEKINAVKEAASEFYQETAAKAQEKAPEFTAKAEAAANSVVEKAREVAPDLTAKAEAAASTVAEKAKEVAPDLIAKAEAAANTVAEKAKEAAPDIIAKAEATANIVAAKAQEIAPEIIAKAEVAAEKAKDFAEGLYSSVTVEITNEPDDSAEDADFEAVVDGSAPEETAAEPEKTEDPEE